MPIEPATAERVAVIKLTDEQKQEVARTTAEHFINVEESPKETGAADLGDAEAGDEAQDSARGRSAEAS